MEREILAYTAFYNGKRYDFEAVSRYDAKKKAIAYFKIRKSREYKVSVNLAQVNGGGVSRVVEPDWLTLDSSHICEYSMLYNDGTTCSNCGKPE